MSRKQPSIPSRQGMVDPVAQRALDAVAEVVEQITARRGEAIATLGPSATTAEIIRRFNELLNKLQT